VKIYGIIPARYASTRFPGKPLAMIFGKTMIQHVWERASAILKEVWVATDDERIAQAVEHFGGKVVHTSSEHLSGTDRCLEAMEKVCRDADAIINIQGDEPYVHSSQLEKLRELISMPHVEIASLMKRIDDPKVLFDQNKVKVITDVHGKALYFSRQAIPFQKGIEPEKWPSTFNYYKHLGLYAYKSEVLRQIASLPSSSLEMAESLEQLRWLQNGRGIYLSETTIETPAVDTPADLEALLAGHGADL
jgi:3-deoxy-manno-octulosonate cytidylyltransferase (CMP-KDO synthetase)